GKLQLSDGTLTAATYMAELAEGTGSLGTPHPDPNLDGWPDPNTGWPNVNTTRMAKNGIKVSSSGDVCIPAVGRRTITTANAYQKMVKPEFGGLSSWNSFVRVYETDLSIPLYSSLVVGAWDTLTQAGGSNTEMFGLHKTMDGLICVGRQTATSGLADGNDIPVINIPYWGSSNPENESCILVYYKAANLINPMDGPAAMSVQNKPSPPQPTLSIYPNPASDQLYFSSLASEIVVYDQLGKRVIRAAKTDHISTQGLSNGVYIVETDGQFHKLVVQR
ncbi:MAG: T9SS type A sorting domain-containing protein, partial [Flavobacteriales bacterium]|nr:T9SS type A sorting domain-containing protein [Flavobacteriales bacterium]